MRSIAVGDEANACYKGSHKGSRLRQRAAFLEPNINVEDEAYQPGEMGPSQATH
ncbi:hypothetical protein HAX54_002203, partial [Datura stramonium]|nr:hypothetical protein [Datura stramonium]